MNKRDREKTRKLIDEDTSYENLLILYNQRVISFKVFSAVAKKCTVTVGSEIHG